jgi:hypothetical protein
LADLGNILVKAWNAAKQQDKASLYDLVQTATPVGMKGMVESQLYRDETGNVKNTKGQNKYETPRTEEEWKTRQLLGVRPLRERLYDEDLYSRDQSYKRMTEAQKEAMARLTSAVNLKDSEGTKRAIDKYLAEGGDPKNISNAHIRQMVEDAYVSGKQRRVLAPKGNLGSINKYREYYE